MTNNYRQREDQLRKILNKNVKGVDKETKVKLQIYYKNSKLKELVLSPKKKPTQPFEFNNVVYQYTCPNDGCKAIETTYIGFTTNTMKIRMQQHFTTGAIRKHHELEHGIRPTKYCILNNTKILRRGNTREDLMLLEALCIKQYVPIINRKDEGFIKTLQIF